MIKLYTNKDYLSSEYRAYVFPLLFDLHFLEHGKLDSYYGLVDEAEACDIAVFPIDITHLLFLGRTKELDDFVNQARELNKRIWVYSGGDIGNTLTYDDVYVFRLGGFHTKMSKRTCILPSFFDDPLKGPLKREFSALPKSDKPEIGFVGHARSGIRKYLEEVSSFIRWNLRRYRRQAYSDFQPFYPSGVVRARYLKMLQAYEGLRCNFVFRSKYRAGATNQLERERTTREFFENIYDNCYTFCIRGHGNFSVRFYEAIALGRIPVLVDTDCRMPLPEVIDWEAHAIIVKEDDARRLPSVIAEFHKNISEEDLIQMQIDNRRLWHEKLTRLAYFKTMHRVLTDTNR